MIQYITGSQCNCLSRGSDGEKRVALITSARQFCTCWSLAKSRLTMLFSAELQQSRWLLISAVNVVFSNYTLTHCCLTEEGSVWLRVTGRHCCSQPLR